MKTICTLHPERSANAREGAPALDQVEREWIVIRCVKMFVYLPAIYLNRAAHERPVDLSPRFKEAMRLGWGLALQLGYRGDQPVPMSVACTADRSLLNQTGWAAFDGLELGEGKLSCPILRGLGDRKVAWLLGAQG